MSDDELRTRGMMPYLRPEHLTTNPQVFKLTGFNVMKDDGTPRAQFVLEVEREDGEMFNLGVRVGSPDHRILHHVFRGAPVSKWIGSVTCIVQHGRQRGVSFVNVRSADNTTPIWDIDPVGDDEPGTEG